MENTNEDFGLDYGNLYAATKVNVELLQAIAKRLAEKAFQPTNDLMLYVANTFVKGHKNRSADDAVNAFIATQKVEEARGNEPQVQLGLYRALEQFENELVGSAEMARKATVDRATARTLTQTYIDFNAGKGLGGEHTQKALQQMKAFSTQLNTGFVGEVPADELLMAGLMAAADKTNPQSLEEVKPFLLLGYSQSSEPQNVLTGVAE